MSAKIRVKPPNKYAELVKEIDSDELLAGLLGYGLFTNKLPDFLTSKQFFNWYLANRKPRFENRGKDYVRYENMRHINVPRLFGVPNPFAYANLCNSISSNWDKIQKHLIENVNNQKHKVSRIHIRKLKDKMHLFEMNYKNLEVDGNPEQKIIIGKRYCVEADVSNCFPSIYSHSIPWALIGKETAKANKDDDNLWYNALDKFIRNTKNEETNGILIGPHVSNLISEIVLTKIDFALCKKGYDYIRNVDDYKCFTHTDDEAERFLLDLSTELKEYELYLNNKKSRICPLPLASISEWVNKINNFDFCNTTDTDGKEILELRRLRALLDASIELLIKENNAAILNYAFKMVSEKKLRENAYRYYLDSVHHLLLLYPYLTSIIDEYVFTPFEVSPTRIKRISGDLYDTGIEKRYFEACSYSIYWALKYNFEIDKSILEDSLNSNDCIFLTLGFLYCKKHLKTSCLKEYKKKAKELSKTDFDQYWIFLYKVLPQPVLSGDYKRIKKDKISFIKKEFDK